MNATARLLLVCAATLALVPSARASGPAPLPSEASGSAGAVAPGGSEKFMTRREGSGTLITAVRLSDNQVIRAQRIPGRWAVPAVTIDNDTTGLSADGTTLILARPTKNYPPARTPLAIVDTRRLALQRRMVLPGFFTVDAIAPDGRTAYLIQYAGGDALDYRVRALDTQTGRLAARDVVDPRKPDEQMGGLPMTRLASPDGRWAYTVYAGGEETFIHALDTVGRTAACIDLDMLASDGDFSGVRLALSHDAKQLGVFDGVRQVAAVDTRTFRVGEPGAAPARTAAPSHESGDGGDGAWPAGWLGILVAALAVVALVLVRRRARPGPRMAPRG